MVKKGLFKITLITFLFVVFHLSSHAQNPKYFIITGKIISENLFIEGASIQIAKNNRPAVTSQIPKHGRFRLELDYNSEYLLTFNQNGFLPKTIQINTQIPEEIGLRPKNFPHFLMAVKLSETDQDEASLLVGNEVQQISYSAQYDCFARVPTIFESQYVDKGHLNSKQRSPEDKSKMQVYQIF